MLYPLDKNGYVINESGREKVQPQYRPVIDNLVHLLQKEVGPTLQSVNIRGSISVGRGIPDLSDIDVVAFTKTKISKEIQRKISEGVQECKNVYTFLPFIDVTVITFNELNRNELYKNLRIYLTTQSYCEWGEDLVTQLPKAKPGKDLALYMYGNIIEELSSLQKTITGDEKRTYLGESRPTEFWCVWLMRVLLRAGLGIVMIQKPVYSQDLITCGEVLASEYPDLRPFIEKAWYYAINPTSNKDELSGFIDEYVPQFIKLWKTNIDK